MCLLISRGQLRINKLNDHTGNLRLYYYASDKKKIKQKNNRRLIKSPTTRDAHKKHKINQKKTKNLRSHYHSSIKQNTSSNCSKWKSKQHSVAVALDNINKTLPRKCDKRAGLNLTHVLWRQKWRPARGYVEKWRFLVAAALVPRLNE